MKKDELLIIEKELRSFEVKAYHGSDVDKCGGQLVCIRMTTYENWIDPEKTQWGTISECVHECQRCHETVILDEKYPRIIHKYM